MSTEQHLISVEDVSVRYRLRTGPFSARRELTAVDGVSLNIGRGETVGLVGESGCGKSTFGRAVLRLTEPASGRVVFDGVDLEQLTAAEMRTRRRRLQMIFQDPYSSLDPKMHVGDIVREPLAAFGIARGAEARERVTELFDAVGLNRTLERRRPAELSGGQRQRVGIARALAVGPEFVVADEPVSALDVSVQAQILNLLADLKASRGLSFLFISHDLRAVRFISDRIAVMYLGRIVELAAAEELYQRPLMPYTKALLSAVPLPDPARERARERIILKGDLPSPVSMPEGCAFHPRCPWAIAECRRTRPPLVEKAPGHFAACIRISPEMPEIESSAAAAASQFS